MILSLTTTMYKLIFTPAYEKLAVKWLRKHSDLAVKYDKTIQLLELNPFHNSLRLHQLEGAMKDFYLISIDMKQRIIIDLYIEGEMVILLKIGLQEEVILLLYDLPQQQIQALAIDKIQFVILLDQYQFRAFRKYRHDSQVVVI